MTYVADAHGIIDPENVLVPQQATYCTYRIAPGHGRGKVLSLQYATKPRGADYSTAVRQRPRL
jgi:hypothetical protein